MEDDELRAMDAVVAALQPLDGPARARVLRWAGERFGGQFGHGAARGNSVAVFPTSEDVADLVHAAQPSTGPERALVVAYWLQEVGQRPGFRGQEVNTALKNLGHPLANVTKTLDSLRAQRPSLVMQVSKSGRSRQARKTYRLTAAGVDRVRRMLDASRGADAAA